MAEGSPGALKPGSNGGSRTADAVAAADVRLLGPVDVVVDGKAFAIDSRRRRTLLAALAVRAGEVVPRGGLIDAVWGDRAPRTAAHALHVHASDLRKLVPSGLPVIGGAGGYVLRIGPERLDTDRFEELAARGRAELSSGDAAAATVTLGEALGLWRGPALADVPWERFADSDVPRWEELRRGAEEDLVDARLATGHHSELIGELDALVREQPYRERRWGQLMVALYRSGRQAEALATYGRLRRQLTHELGIEPSPPIRELELMVLRQDDALAPPGREADIPVTRFARAPAGRIAYQVIGRGAGDLVFVPGFGGNVEIRWEEPNLSRLYRRLARSARLVLLDRRGTGLSDRDTGIPPIEDQVDDVLAVMDAAGVERAVVFGVMDGGALGLLAAAAHPERIAAVVTYACFTAFDLLGPDARSTFDQLRAQLDDGLLFEDTAELLAPTRVGDVTFGRWMGRYMRMAAGVGGAAALLDRWEAMDVRAALPDVTVPVTALHRAHDPFIPPANAAEIAARVQVGRAVLLPGRDSIIWSGDVDAVAAEVEHVLAAQV